MDQLLQTLQTMGDALSQSLVLEGFPVGVKMLAQDSDLDQVQYKGRPVRRLSKRLVICQLVALARYYGTVIGGTAPELSVCRLGATSLGFPVEDCVGVYTDTYFKGQAAARKMIDTTPKFAVGRYRAMLVGPLGKLPLEPDVVVVHGNVAQLLRIINGYLYDKGGRMEFSVSGDAGLCADTIVLPMLSHKPHLAIPCNGGRLLSMPSLTDLACGIPFDLLPGILEGIAYTGKNVPIMYPPAWQHINWELKDDAPVKAFLERGSA